MIVKLGVITLLVAAFAACALFEQTPTCPKNNPRCDEFPTDPKPQLAHDAGVDG